MGAILDSSAVIVGERRDQSAADLLAYLRGVLGPEEVALATVSVIELEHGIWRAVTPAQAARRQKFFNELFAVVPTYPLTSASPAERQESMANPSEKHCDPFQDLVIGVTALEFDYSVATTNVRHFQMIPGLRVNPL